MGVLSGWEGSANDAFLWRKLKEKNIYNFSPPQFLIGDCGFPLERTMLVPYRGVVYHEKGNREPPANPKEAFNRMHARARACVERAFGVLKMRFPSLKKGSSIVYSNVGDLVISCMCLHNMIMRIDNQDGVDEFRPRGRNADGEIHGELESQEENERGGGDQAAETWRSNIALDEFYK